MDRVDKMERLQEVRRFQKIASLLKEDDNLDLSDTPKFEKTEYTPKEIDSFVEKATKNVQELTKFFNSFKDKVQNLTIKSMVEDSGQIKDIKEKAKSASKLASDTHDFYYTVVEKYDWSEMPANVKKLEKLTEKLNYLQENFRYIKYAVESMAEAATDFLKFYEEEEDSEF